MNDNKVINVADIQQLQYENGLLEQQLRLRAICAENKVKQLQEQLAALLSQLTQDSNGE